VDGQFSGHVRVAIVRAILDGALDLHDPINTADEVNEDLGIAAPIHGALEPDDAAMDVDADRGRVDQEPARNHPIDHVGSVTPPVTSALDQQRMIGG
jgi:hypothetical protein